MAQPREKLARSLEALRQLQSEGKGMDGFGDFTRTHLVGRLRVLTKTDSIRLLDRGVSSKSRSLPR
jgi:hypothetical protein